MSFHIGLVFYHAGSCIATPKWTKQTDTLNYEKISVSVSWKHENISNTSERNISVILGSTGGIPKAAKAALQENPGGSHCW
jgi:hypothetical protein